MVCHDVDDMVTRNLTLPLIVQLPYGLHMSTACVDINLKAM
jgi:hypothetical protein